MRIKEAIFRTLLILRTLSLKMAQINEQEFLIPHMDNPLAPFVLSPDDDVEKERVYDLKVKCSDRVG